MTYPGELVDRNASLSSITAYLMDDPVPGGYILSAAVRISRVLYAYEWSKTVIKEEPDMPGYYRLPNEEDIIAAVSEHEQRQYNAHLGWLAEQAKEEEDGE